MAIIKKKAALERVRLADDVAYLIASRIKSNIRELEGSLTRMIAFCALTGREMARRPRPGGPRRALGRGREDHHHRPDPAAGLRLLRPEAVRPEGQDPDQGHRLPAAGRHVPRPPADALVPRRRSAAPSAARTTRPSCTRWTRSRRSCRKIPNYARRSTDLSRASTCDPPRSPALPTRLSPDSTSQNVRGAAATFRASTPIHTAYDDLRLRSCFFLLLRQHWRTSWK